MSPSLTMGATTPAKYFSEPSTTGSPVASPDSIAKTIFFSIVFSISSLILFSTSSIKFWVCPSFDEKGNCDGIGFRIVDSNSVKNAYKWIVLQGNNIIYGKDSVDINKDCYIVEGFRDFIALKELGYNVIGLGSVIISKLQEKYINQLKSPILLLDNDNFGLKKSIQYKDKYRVATLVNSKQKDAYDAWTKEGKINISEII